MQRLQTVSALALGLALVAPVASASVTLVPPADWVADHLVDTRAHQRATRWAESLGGTLASVRASSGADDFIETLAVIEVSRLAPSEVLEDEAKAIAWLNEELSKITGGAPGEDMAFAITPDVPSGLVRGSYDLEGVRLVAAAVPDGNRTTFVLLAARTSEDLFYEPMFSDVISSLAGGAAPVRPYPVGKARNWNLLAWGIGAIGVAGVSMAAFSERRGDHRRVGRIAATILIVVAAIAAVVMFMTLRAQTVGLEAAGSSAGAVAGEVFAVGAIAAAIVFFGGQMLEGTEQRVRSAPSERALNTRLQAADLERTDANDGKSPPSGPPAPKS